MKMTVRLYLDDGNGKTKYIVVTLKTAPVAVGHLVRHDGNFYRVKEIVHSDDDITLLVCVQTHNPLS